VGRTPSSAADPLVGLVSWGVLVQRDPLQTSLQTRGVRPTKLPQALGFQPIRFALVPPLQGGAFVLVGLLRIAVRILGTRAFAMAEGRTPVVVILRLAAVFERG